MIVARCAGCGKPLSAEGYAGPRHAFATKAIAETAARFSGWAVHGGAYECPDCKPQTTEG